VISNPEIVKNPDRLKNYGAIIKQENNRLNKQVEKVLQIARIEKSGFELKMEEVKLHDIILNVVANCNTNNNHEDAQISTKLGGGEMTIMADRLHITNILHNLLDNAIKYADKQPLIVISTEKTRKKIVIGIEDNGPGISREYQKKVFQKFFRIPTGNVHNVKGFGLGLYYVRNICRAHRWEIRLESETGKGSKFIIEIPA
jgi:two-component system phosphate regulon sensor histidine kinase PhoR